MLTKFQKGAISQQDFENFLLKSHAPQIFTRRRLIQRKLDHRKRLIEKAWGQIPWNDGFVNSFNEELFILPNGILSVIVWIIWVPVIMIAWALFFALTFSRFGLLATLSFPVSRLQSAELIKLDRLAASVIKQAYSEILD